MKHLTIGYSAYAEKTIEVSDEVYEKYIKSVMQYNDDDNDCSHDRWREIYQSILDIAKNVDITLTEIDESEPFCVLDENKEVIEEF